MGSGYRSPVRPIPVNVFSNPSVIGSSGMLDDNQPVNDSCDWRYQLDVNDKPNFLQCEDTVEDISSDSWWHEAIKVVEDVENKQISTENKQTMGELSIVVSLS